MSGIKSFDRFRPESCRNASEVMRGKSPAGSARDRGGEAAKARCTMSQLHGLWVSFAAVLLFGAVASTASAQETMTFEGSIATVNDPEGLVTGVFVGDLFSGSLEINLLIPFPIAGPSPSQYLVANTGSVLVGPHGFDPINFGNPYQFVQIGNEVPLFPLATAGVGDSWSLGGFRADPSVIGANHYCLVALQTPSPGPVDGEGFYVPSDLGD